MALVFVIATVLTGLLGSWQFAPIVGWALACAVFLAWVWMVIGRMDPDQTKEHSTREDPTNGVTDILILIAGIAGLVGIVVLMVEGGSGHGALRALTPTLAILSIALSWALVHTLYTLRYARLFYTDDAGGIDFNQKQPPKYSDFAYVAFTLGATFQISDTDILNSRMRATVLRHALLSYVFGSVIIAATVNLVAGLAR